MNSDLNPSSKSFNTAADQDQTISAVTESLTQTDSNQAYLNRQQPIPPPSEPMQYRAIGLVRGRYNASAEQLTQGTLVVTDGAELNAVLLGRIISLLKNHLDLKQEHLWVVYPRTGQQDDSLHLQIVGVWEPDKLSNLATERPTPEADNIDTRESQEVTTPEIEDNYFSIRGEIVYQSAAEGNFIVKIKQAPRKESEKAKYFKLKLQGDLGNKAVGQFWDLHATRQGDSLVLQHGEAIAVLPSKPKLRKKPPQGSYPTPKRNWDTPSPVRKLSDPTKPVTKPIPKSPTPKPIKRQKPPQ